MSAEYAEYVGPSLRTTFPIASAEARAYVLECAAAQSTA